MDWGQVFSGGITACAGAEVHLIGDGTFELRLLQLSLHQKLVHIEAKKQYMATLATINQQNVKGPLAITLTGRGVLIKKTAKLEMLTEQSMRALFPNFKIAEFYIQHFSSGDFSFIALVRKEMADAVLAAFSAQGAEVLMLSLGPFVVEQVIPLLNNYNGNVDFDGHQLVLSEEKTWLDYSYSAGQDAGFELKVDMELLPGQFLLGYGTAFQLLLQDRLELVAVEAPDIAERLTELGAKLKFPRRGLLLLGFFLVLLLVNFLVFSHYHSANLELAGKAGQRSDVFSGRQKMEGEIREKELLVKKLGWNKGLSYAYLCDQIGQTVPAAVSLSAVEINASRDNVYGMAKKKSELETGSMRITGQSASVYVLNDWIYTLRHRPWLKSVLLEKYVTDDQQQAQVFTLLLTY